VDGQVFLVAESGDAGKEQAVKVDVDFWRLFVSMSVSVRVTASNLCICEDSATRGRTS
jgi:hypothetical protein